MDKESVEILFVSSPEPQEMKVQVTIPEMIKEKMNLLIWCNQLPKIANQLLTKFSIRGVYILYFFASYI